MCLDRGHFLMPTAYVFGFPSSYFYPDCVDVSKSGTRKARRDDGLAIHLRKNQNEMETPHTLFVFFL